jgi:tRNA modification GTPase
MNRPKPKVSRETIAAIATPTGRGGIGVVRLSGDRVRGIAVEVTRKVLEPRVATFGPFFSDGGAVIDQGLALLFPAPHSYTGEDVLELHGHGGPAVMQGLLQRCLDLGCKLAQPGEFTQRAFLNDKLDLAQAESVADLIEASSFEAAQSAARSLVGEFSGRVHRLTDALIDLRMHVEACIDFPEEEIDPADRRTQQEKLQRTRTALAMLMAEAGQGALLRDGMTVVLIGCPNVGKSSILNRLAGDELAIVTPIAGTTRDQVRTTILVEGVPVHLIDTAGLRETADEVERIGIERTWKAIQNASAALLITEAGEDIGAREAEILSRIPATLPVAWVRNKIDIHGQRAERFDVAGRPAFGVSALSGEGVPMLKQWLLETAGWRVGAESVFMARERHLRALADAENHLLRAQQNALRFELYAEDLRLAQHALASITGEFTPDDLLGEIFSRFCIGK